MVNNKIYLDNFSSNAFIEIYEENGSYSVEMKYNGI